MCKAGKSFQLCQVSHECFLTGILPIDSMVSATQGYKVIPDMSMAVNRLLQLTISVVAIHFELVGFHEVSFLAFIPCSKECGSPTERWGATSHEN